MQPTVSLVQEMTLAEIEEYLRRIDARPSDPAPEAVSSDLAGLKRTAADRRDDAAAKHLWCLEQAHAAQTASTNIRMVPLHRLLQTNTSIPGASGSEVIAADFEHCVSETGPYHRKK